MALKIEELKYLFFDYDLKSFLNKNTLKLSKKYL